MKEYIDTTAENVQMILDKVATYANDKNFDVKGNLTITGELTFSSQSQQKVLRNYLTRLDKKVTRSQANRFLHALKRYTTDFSARIELSERETAIQKAKKEWKIARDKSDQLLAQYKEIKGDFYK